MPGKLNKELILKYINQGLPGRSAQLTMAPEMDRRLELPDYYRKAAVLILLYEEKGKIKIVFIKRNEYEGHHSGQVSFPGGMYEPADYNLEQTAIRETFEETGVSNEIIELIGPLTELYIPVSNICVQPYVAWAKGTPSFDPDHSEVQYLICPDLEQVFSNENIKKGSFIRGDKKIVTPYLDVSGEIIWGATAMILGEFKALVGY